MKVIQFKRSNLTPNLREQDKKGLFIGINIALVVGGLSLILTFLFLLLNLERADEILIFCLPGFCLGIALMVLYALGHQKLMRKR